MTLAVVTGSNRGIGLEVSLSVSFHRLHIVPAVTFAIVPVVTFAVRETTNLRYADYTATPWEGVQGLRSVPESIPRAYSPWSSHH